jgi:hypothetical protein
LGGERISGISQKAAGNAPSFAFGEAASLADLVGRHHSWLRVSAGGDDLPRLTWRWDDLAAEQAAGKDPTEPWRTALAVSTARQHGRPAPRAMPAAFVLQWALEVPATVTAYAAVLSPWDPDLSGASLSFDLSAQHFPDHVQIRGARLATTGGEVRLAAARAAYEVLARPFAATYEPGVRLGPHQRHAMVDDVWRMALHRAQQAAGERPRPLPGRQSCCYLYVLPGTHECTGCPRLSR